MFKIMVTCKKRKDLSRAEFIDYYENKHLPLARELCPPLYKHRRNYVISDHPFLEAVFGDRTGEEELPFDVISELFFETEEQARTCMAGMQDPAVLDQILKDEAKLYEPGGIRFFVVQVHQSAIPWK
jgi:hypothetical protein